MGGILVVDDQAGVRGGIIKMIGEMNISIEPICEAGDGIEALDIARKQRPDIVLVDIMMPRLDGLQLIEMIKNEKIRCRIIIISAYSDFTYTKKAIDFKVDGYIMKPVSQKELFQVIISVLEGIEDEKLNTMLSTKQEQQYNYMLLYEFLSGRDVLINVEFLYKSTGIINMSKNFFQILIFECSNLDPNHTEVIKQELEKHDTQELNPQICFINGQKIILIVNTDEENGIDICSKLNNLTETGSISFFCGISGISNSRSKLQEIYRQGEIALKECMFKGARECYYNNIRNSIEIVIKVKDCDLILHYMRAGEVESLNESVDLMLTLLTRSVFSAESAQNIMFSVLNYLYMNLKETYTSLLSAADTREQILQAGSMLKMKAVFKEAIEGMHLVIQSQTNADGSTRIINNVKNYIHNHLSQVISLAFIANELNMNYYYLSSLFAKKVGVSFSEYILKMRLERAKELLLHSNDKIYEICKKSGFNDPKHFSKIFKKYINITPEQYRKNGNENLF